LEDPDLTAKDASTRWSNIYNPAKTTVKEIYAGLVTQLNKQTKSPGTGFGFIAESEIIPDEKSTLFIEGLFVANAKCRTL
jgi:hypothetical protein